MMEQKSISEQEKDLNELKDFLGCWLEDYYNEVRPLKWLQIRLEEKLCDLADKVYGDEQYGKHKGIQIRNDKQD